jgi:hypothetical protein
MLPAIYSRKRPSIQNLVAAQAHSFDGNGDGDDDTDDGEGYRHRRPPMLIFRRLDRN